MRLVEDKKTAEPRDAVLVRRLAVALAEYDGVPVSQRHYTRSKRLRRQRGARHVSHGLDAGADLMVLATTTSSTRMTRK